MNVSAGGEEGRESEEGEFDVQGARRVHVHKRDGLHAAALLQWVERAAGSVCCGDTWTLGLVVRGGVRVGHTLAVAAPQVRRGRRARASAAAQAQGGRRRRWERGGHTPP